MEHTDYLILGGGMSGLAFADRVRDQDYLLCEAEHELGGYCRTVVRDGFTWDYSGHFFHFRHPDIEKHLVSRMSGQRVLKIERDSRIYWKGAFIDFPFQKNIHQLPREDFLDCLVDLFFKKDTEATNFKEMLYGKLGKSIAEMFLIPYNEKLYATDLSTLDVDAMGRFFPHADVADIVRNFRQPDNKGYNATFTYPEGGAIQYVRALESGLDAKRILLDERVIKIDLGRKVATTPKREIVFKHAISSAPFPRLLAIAGVDHDPNLYSYNKVLVFNLGFDRKGLAKAHWVYFPQRELCFYRVGFYDNIFDSDRMSLYVELGYERDAVLTDREIEQARLAVLQDLKTAGIVDQHQLVAWHSVVLDPAYVHITKGSQIDLAQRKEQLRSAGVHSIGRYGSWTYCSIEDNIVEARALADSLR